MSKAGNFSSKKRKRKRVKEKLRWKEKKTRDKCDKLKDRKKRLIEK
jgi:hypothetical protein